MRIGIDFGNTIMRSVREDGKIESVWTEQPGAFKTIGFWSRLIGPENLHIISRVDNKAVIWRTMDFLLDNQFYDKTGFLVSGLHFCYTRLAKAPIAAELGITVHIDDRPEVMAHLDTVAHKILFHPVASDLEHWSPLIGGAVYVAESWQDVHETLLGIKEGKPDKRAGTVC